MSNRLNKCRFVGSAAQLEFLVELITGDIQPNKTFAEVSADLQDLAISQPTQQKIREQLDSNKFECQSWDQDKPHSQTTQDAV